MRKALPAGLRRSFFLATQGLVARLREVKDADEIVKMRRAAALGCRLFEGVLTNLSAGETENEIALVMELEARRAGAEAMSFETIVASGKRSASAAWPGERGEASEARVCDAGFWSGAGWLLLGHDPDGPHGKGHARASGTCIIRCWKRSRRGWRPCGRAPGAAMWMRPRVRFCARQSWSVGLHTPPGTVSGWRYMKGRGLRRSRSRCWNPEWWLRLNREFICQMSLEFASKIWCS